MLDKIENNIKKYILNVKSLFKFNRFKITILVCFVVLYNIRYDLKNTTEQTRVLIILILFTSYFIFGYSWSNISKNSSDLVIATINFVENLFKGLSNDNYYNILQKYSIDLVFIIILFLISLWIIQYLEYSKYSILDEFEDIENINTLRRKKNVLSSIKRLIFIFICIVILFLLYYFNDYLNIIGNDDLYEYLKPLFIYLVIILIFSEKNVRNILSSILDIIVKILYILFS